jgi:hypothetical protein
MTMMTLKIVRDSLSLEMGVNQLMGALNNNFREKF